MIRFDQERGPPGACHAKQEIGSMPNRTWTRVLRIIGVMRSQHHPSYFGELTMTLNMFIRPILLTIVVFLTLFIGNPSAHAQFDPQHIRAVDANATGNNDGTSWTDAYNYLQDALTEARDPLAEITEIWVAATDPGNPYRPDQDAANPGGTGDKEATFLLDFNNITILGGFAGSETDAILRDPINNITVLSGEISDPVFCGPESGDCFEDNGTPGCNDLDCCVIVCESLPECCESVWDFLCAAFAVEVCQPPPPAGPQNPIML